MTDRPQTLGFIGGEIDRVDPIRTDPARFVRALRDPRAGLLALDGIDPVLAPSGGLGIVPMPADAAPERHALLGLIGGAPVFVALPDGPLAGRRADRLAIWRSLGTLDEASIAHYGLARSLVDWHARHGFCAQCGARTAPAKAGWARECGSCGAEHFPRVDPVVIMLPEYAGRILVGRQPGFAPGRYSALAGFVEQGETIEEAVARELHEEAGIRVSRVDYVRCQPWPFPSSLMIGCMAQATGDALVIDETELEDAIWVDRAGVLAALAERDDAPFLPPPPVAIAYHLLRHWLAMGEEA